jgi:hypothetical protein
MANMGKYCKAYPVERLREFSGWSENFQNIRKDKKQVDGREVERQPEDVMFLYLQENYVVTDGIFIDENVIFDSVTPEWVDYCHNNLQFEVPVYDSAQAT